MWQELMLRWIDSVLLEISEPNFIMKVNLVKQKVHQQRKVAQMKMDVSIPLMSGCRKILQSEFRSAFQMHLNAAAFDHKEGKQTECSLPISRCNA